MTTFFQLFMILAISINVAADDTIKIDDHLLDIHSTLKSNEDIKISIQKDSVEWFRTNDVIMEAKVRLSISSQKRKGLTVKYKGAEINLQESKTQSFTTVFYHLFDTDKVQVLDRNKVIGEISIRKNKDILRDHIVRDYSCQQYDFKVKGIANEFFTLGCKTVKYGQLGQEKRMVKVFWKSPAYKQNSTAHFTTSDPVVISVENHEGEQSEIEISGNIPKRFKRLNVAYGLGPYAFEATFEGERAQRNTTATDTPIAPALMLYFNYHVNDDASIRGFDAVVFRDSVFNNMGAYYANNIFYLDNKQFSLTTLLGVQHLYFQFEGTKKIVNKPIFPQGLEFNYKNAFGHDGYTLGAGAFISPSDSYDYQNLWVRFGKNVFWELNYIYWGENEFSAKTWGVSAGFLFGSFL